MNFQFLSCISSLRADRSAEKMKTAPPATTMDTKMSGSFRSQRQANRSSQLILVNLIVFIIIQVPHQTNSIKTTTTTTEENPLETTPDSQINSNNNKQRTLSEIEKQNNNNNKIAKQNGKNSVQANCQYVKSQWDECNSEGIQLRTMKLKWGSSESCEPIRTIRRDCKTVGCKYARGEWSELCQDGHRVRVDKLIGRIGNAANCKPERRVTKDCRRTCHYVKSAWTECINGTKTRSLTLDDGNLSSNSIIAATRSAGQRASLLVTMAPVGQHCVHSKLVRRDCRNVSKSTAAAATTSSTNDPTQTTGRNNNLTASQKRRLKLQQLKQSKPFQQQQQQQGTTTSATPAQPGAETTTQTAKSTRSR